MHTWLCRKGDPHVLLMTVYTSLLTLEISSKILNKNILCSSFITPNIYSRYSTSYCKDSCTSIVIATLFTTDRKWNHTRFPPKDK